MPTVYEVESNVHLKGSLLESSVITNKQGHTVSEYQYENTTEKVIELAPRARDMSDEKKVEFISMITEEVRGIKEGKAPTLDKYSDQEFTCLNRLNSTDPSFLGAFLPVYAATASSSSSVSSFSGMCYNNITMTYN